MFQTRRPLQVDAIAFDLLTALIDSWTLWEAVAEDVELGRSWRRTSLALITATGAYVPYEQMVQQAASAVGLPNERAKDLLDRWGELRPWPEVPDVLAQLRQRRLAIVTNCSQRLAEIAAERTGGRFELIVSAERAGAYKVDRRAYQAALDGLNLPAERVLFVAGSAHDVPGASALGMPVYWSNRQALPPPDGSAPLVDAPDLTELPALLD
jgi:2-haloalkanoic acid dehalogenase type II